MPTGGVELNKENISGWFKAGVCAVGMGSKLITKEILQNKLYDKLYTDTVNALKLVAIIQAGMNEKPGNYRWVICALMFFATTINYLDRAVISLLKPYLTKDFHWNDGDYANMEIAFKVAYSVGLFFAGRIIDRLGTKMGYFFATFLWSVSAVLHAAGQQHHGFRYRPFGFGLERGG